MKKITRIKLHGIDWELRQKTHMHLITGFRVFAKGANIYNKVVDHVNAVTPSQAMERLFSFRDIFAVYLEGKILDVVSYSKAQVLSEEDVKDILIRGNGFSPYIEVKKLNTPDTVDPDDVAPFHDPNPRENSAAKIWGLK